MENNVPDLARFFELSRDLLMVVKHDGTIIKISPSWESLGYKAQEMEGTLLQNFVHPDDISGTAEAIEKMTNKNFVLRDFTNRYKHKNGTYKTLYWTSWIQDGLYWGIAKDITASLEAEKQLEQSRAEAIHASRMAALGEMAAGIAHEINNPLAIIHGYADRIIRFVDENKLGSAEAHRLSTKILGATERIEKIVKSLTHLSRKHTSWVLEKRSIHNILEDILNISNEKFHSNGIRLEVPQNSKDVFIFCVPHEMSQALLNLLNNSYDAVIDQHDRWIRVELSESQSHIILSIIDSGTSIPKEIKERLWEPFFTSKETGKGTGLGLSITQKIIQSHRGRIYLDESKENTCFTIELPKISNQ